MNYKARHFKPHEYVCPCCGLDNLAPEFLRRLDFLRGLCGFPLIINSACRCDKHNRAVGGGNYSGHLEGVAADVGIYGERAWWLLKYALTMDFSGIGIMQKGDFNKRFIHLDDSVIIDGRRPRPIVWTY